MKKERIHVLVDTDLAQILRVLTEQEERPISRTIVYYLKEGLKAHGHPTTAEEPPPRLAGPGRTREQVEALIEQHPEAQDLLQNYPDEPPPPDEEPQHASLYRGRGPDHLWHCACGAKFSTVEELRAHLEPSPDEESPQDIVWWRQG